MSDPTPRHPQIQQVRSFRQIDSTNAEAMRRKREWAGQNVLLLADEQTAGRGRHGRSWYSPPGEGLWMSLSLGDSWWLNNLSPLFSLYCGVVLYRALHHFASPPPDLKWPNDLLLSGKKVAGILVETCWQGNRVEQIVVGMGINLDLRKTALPEDLRDWTTCLVEHANSEIGRSEVLGTILDHFFADRDLLRENKQLSAAWNAACSQRGRIMEVHQGRKILSGTFLGVDDEGRARIQTGGGIAILSSGAVWNEEVSGERTPPDGLPPHPA